MIARNFKLNLIYIKNIFYRTTTVLPLFAPSFGLKLLATESHMLPTELPLNWVIRRLLDNRRLPRESVPVHVKRTRKSQFIPVAFVGLLHSFVYTEQILLSVIFDIGFDVRYCWVLVLLARVRARWPPTQRSLIVGQVWHWLSQIKLINLPLSRTATIDANGTTLCVFMISCGHE
jgi:hypothetical protein